MLLRGGGGAQWRANQLLTEEGMMCCRSRTKYIDERLSEYPGRLVFWVVIEN